MLCQKSIPLSGIDLAFKEAKCGVMNAIKEIFCSCLFLLFLTPGRSAFRPYSHMAVMILSPPNLFPYDRHISLLFPTFLSTRRHSIMCKDRISDYTSAETLVSGSNALSLFDSPLDPFLSRNLMKKNLSLPQ